MKSQSAAVFGANHSGRDARYIVLVMNKRIGKINAFLKELDDAYVSFCETPIGTIGDDIEKCLGRLSEYLHDDGFLQTIEPALISEQNQTKINLIRNVYAKHYVSSEAALALDVINGKKRLTDNFGFVGKNALKEATAAAVDSGSNVLFVGSGPYPKTVISIVEKFKCQTVCFEINPEAVDLSRRLIQKLRLEQYVRIFLSQELPEKNSVRGYSHVFIAGHVPEKLYFIESVYEQGDANVVLVVRYSNGFQGVFNYGLEKFPVENWKIVDLIKNPGLDSIILRKNIVGNAKTGT